jgi:broad specificity polyphosphatase/5'/3'-nucleotidase SurE
MRPRATHRKQLEAKQNVMAKPANPSPGRQMASHGNQAKGGATNWLSKGTPTDATQAVLKLIFEVVAPLFQVQASALRDTHNTNNASHKHLGEHTAVLLRQTRQFGLMYICNLARNPEHRDRLLALNVPQLLMSDSHLVLLDKKARLFTIGALALLSDAQGKYTPFHDTFFGLWGRA